jgi:protein involved in sex pheromone biosynthesis
LLEKNLTDEGRVAIVAVTSFLIDESHKQYELTISLQENNTTGTGWLAVFSRFFPNKTDEWHIFIMILLGKNLTGEGWLSS